MRTGEIVICNDVLGFVIEDLNTKLTIKMEEGKVLTLPASKCVTVINPIALSRMFYDRLVRRIPTHERSS